MGDRVGGGVEGDGDCGSDEVEAVDDGGGGGEEKVDDVEEEEAVDGERVP